MVGVTVPIEWEMMDEYNRYTETSLDANTTVMYIATPVCTNQSKANLVIGGKYHDIYPSPEI